MEFEKPDKVQVQLEMERKIREKLRELSKKEGIPMVSLVEQMVLRACEEAT